MIAFFIFFPGSSPQVRGKRYSLAGDVHFARLIPAGAGKTL